MTELREQAARIVAIVRGDSRGREDAIDVVLAELEAVAAEPREVEVASRRQLGALLELARGQEREQWDLAEALRQITELAADTLGVARVGAWFFDEPQTTLRCVDLFEATARAHLGGVQLDRDDFPRYFALLMEARVIAVRDALHDLRTAEFAAMYFAPHRVVSTLDAPIRSQGALVGVLCCEHVGAQRPWRADEVRFIASLADAVTLALEVERRRGVEQALAQKQALIEAQQAALQRLASPVLEVWDGVLAVPLAGCLDPARRGGVTEALLASIRERRPAFVVLDLSGVDVVDLDTTIALADMVRRASERGVQCVISGIHGDIAQTMIAAYPELRGLVTTSSLKTGLQHCLQRQR